ncbi:MAG: M28 family peptidase [Thermoanaerobaculia bacterium]
MTTHRLSALLSLALSSFASFAFAQTAPAPVATTAAPPVDAAAAARIKADVTYLASPPLKGRRAGTAEADVAADWVAARLKSLGLAPAGTDGGWFQKFDFIDGVDLGPKNALATSVGGTPKSWAVDADFRPLAFSAPGTVAGEVVFAGYGITAPDLSYDDYAGLDVKDKVVLVLRYSPDGDDEKSPFSPFAALRFKASLAREKGAKALLVAAGPLTKDVADDLVAMRTDAAFADAGLVAVSIRRPVAEALFSASGKTLEAAQKAIDEAKKPASFPLEITTVSIVADVSPRRAVTRNVVAILRNPDGLKKNEIVVVGAHYDHLGMGGGSSLDRSGQPRIHPGADDNASGTAALLELARVFSAKRASLMRSILFISFAAEEEGTLGSLQFTKNPTVPMDSLTAMVNLDMIGRLRENKLNVQGVGTSPAWKPLVDKSNEEAKLTLSLQQGGFGPSDHSPFYAAKKPVLFAFTGAHADYHKPEDTADKVDAGGIERVVAFVTPVIEGVVNAPERIAFTPVKDETPPRASRSFRVWVGGIPDFSEEKAGVKFSGVTAGSPAEKAGMQAGDLLVKVGDKEIRNLYDYTYALQALKPGQKVICVVKRTENGQVVEKPLEVTLGSRPDTTK